MKKRVFSIIEFNSAGSEPNIFMIPNILFFMRGKEIARHLNILYTISKINHHQLNIPFTTFSEGMQLFTELIQVSTQAE